MPPREPTRKPIPPSERRYRLDPGLQQMLALAAKDLLPGRLTDWQKQIETGVIDDVCATVLSACQYVSSKEDPRMHIEPAVAAPVALLSSVKPS
jgi:hypothetical protein